MSLTIALAGNPNCGKTTLFNGLTGSNQFVGNWPGVTVEKKEGKLKQHSDVVITDLPGIYSLSPYTLEEVVARNYLLGERPDAILNIIDGTNLERNLYLTTQLTELGIPVVVAVNMMDIVEKNGDKINIEELGRELGCKVVEISALKGRGIMEAAEAAIHAAKNEKTIPQHTFCGPVEHALAHIEELVLHDMPEEQQRWYAIKIFERDSKVLEQLNLSEETRAHIEKDIEAAETEEDDDSESIITNERYVYIASIIKGCYKKVSAGKLTISDKIDRIVTNRILALPIFAVIMFIVYYGLFYKYRNTRNPNAVVCRIRSFVAVLVADLIALLLGVHALACTDGGMTMKTYIGTKIIEAAPAIRMGGKVYDANELIPRSMEMVEEGYKVRYQDGYESWSPKAVFEEAYRPIDGMNFGLAIEAMKKGKKCSLVGLSFLFNLPARLHFLPFFIAFAFCGTSGIQMGWLASQADMLSDDWEIVE